LYEWITFDLFSAVLDIEGSGLPRVEAVLKRPPEECLAFFRAWRKSQWEYVLLNGCMNNGRLSYREITRCALRYTRKTTGVELTPAKEGELMSVWYNFRAWPDAKEAVERLKEMGFRVAVLSNGDDDILDSLQRSCGISFDRVFSAERCGHYKPHPAIYALPATETGLPREKILHVAGSLFDMTGAKAAGIPCAWVNRRSEFPLDDRYRPDYEMRTLTELSDIVQKRGRRAIVIRKGENHARS
jgi:2-haloacid dehalogenase